MRWAAATQNALVNLSWPPAVLQWPVCAEERDPITQRPLWRGLRVRMGIAHGRAQFRKPLNTGVHEWCARTCPVAVPSQLRMHCLEGGFIRALHHWPCCWGLRVHGHRPTGKSGSASPSTQSSMLQVHSCSCLASWGVQ